MNNKANKTSFKKGQKAPISAFKKGFIPWNKNKKMTAYPNSGFKKGNNFGANSGSFTKGQTVGEKNANWKGGITPENVKIRHSIEFSLWRKACFERDNWTCQKYKISGGKLVVHHINNFADYPEFRTSIDNGITLSEKAHKEFHKIYGQRNNTREQLLEFVGQAC